MKNKVIVLFLLCLVLAFAGNGCIGTQYSKEDEQATEELGKKMMQEWLNENMKGEKVSDKGISALAEGLLGGNYYLSNLVEGTYSDTGEKYTFIINTTTGAVYSSKNYPAFKESAWKLFLKELGLNENEIIPEDSEKKKNSEDYFSIKYSIEASLKEGKYNKEAAKDTYFQKEVLPIDIEDTAAFAADSKNRNIIEMTGSIHLKENVDLSVLTLNELMGEREKAGLNFTFLYIYDEDEDIVDYGTKLTYKKHGYLDMGDYQLYAVVEQHNEVSENGKIDHTEGKLDETDYQPITVIDSGYDIKPGTNSEIYQGFNIIAKEGSEIMKYDYNLEKPNTEGKYEKYDECCWEDRGDGTFALAAVGKEIINFGSNSRLTVREER